METHTLKGIAPHVKMAVNKLNKDDQSAFFYSYNKKKLYLGTGVVAFILGLHYAHIGRWGIQILFIIAAFMYIGFVWWVLLLFQFVNDINTRNTEIAQDILMNMKLLK